MLSFEGATLFIFVSEADIMFLAALAALYQPLVEITFRSQRIAFRNHCHFRIRKQIGIQGTSRPAHDRSRNTKRQKDKNTKIQETKRQREKRRRDKKTVRQKDKETKYKGTKREFNLVMSG